MKFSRISRGVAAVAIVLALLALLFHLLPAAIASGGLVFFLAGRATLSLSALKSAAGSLRIQRTFSPHLVRQGIPVRVVNDGHIAIPTGVSAIVADPLPHGTVLASGSNRVSVSGNTANFRLDYSITPLSTGTLTFAGVRLSLSDPFYSSDLEYRNKADAMVPPLVVLPSSEYPLAEVDIMGEKATARFKVQKSPDVRGFREFLPGDDPKTIDWKISAKYDNLYVREYMGKAERSNLVIIDLPDAALPFNTEAFVHLKDAAVSGIMGRISDRIPSSVLIISGPNLISFTSLEPDPRQLRAMLEQLTQVPRLHHFYRYRSTAVMKRRISRSARSDIPFSRDISRISKAMVAKRSPSSFELNIGRVFRAFPGSIIHLFTLGIRDTSHIRILQEQAALNDIPLHIHVPEDIRKNLAVPLEVV